MTGPLKDLTVERFEGLLDAYGGDLSRWPSQHAPAAEALLRRSAEARSRPAEAKALDRLLGETPTPDPARLSLLADRIVDRAISGAAARAAPSTAEARVEARVIRLPRPSSRPDVRMPAVARASSVRPPATPWRSAAALAASLLMGVAIGLTDIAQTTTLGIASLTEAAMSEAEVVMSAVQLDTLNALDEDQI